MSDQRTTNNQEPWIRRILCRCCQRQFVWPFCAPPKRCPKCGLGPDFQAKVAA